MISQKVSTCNEVWHKTVDYFMPRRAKTDFFTDKELIGITVFIDVHHGRGKDSERILENQCDKPPDRQKDQE